mmetsp:Transcript_96520/g.171602  ORF Transcript_96520/g.171602 Transcript_96520/m.171602 type:complete len:350 (+) Transcript_96520:86-1135(+)|eukprot:CAMPEP_0197637022 /NCGR_PEP_ID=MMETSP1338-20131121/12367_1 /TAXON_ID=43686 ORGANISM="Pelagodinium beii, Strain RCC1491" /NCGR_SAMPLE_ID=MMETSP1338 /ASSEMBLY_ACC=CAM_ASM_000754 /LENGTH=349 /DNA_ID=CAMNT_0043209375 /DNA_START=63 /DNA_END=1112 /DNA_ORIENTATION=-
MVDSSRMSAREVEGAGPEDVEVGRRSVTFSEPATLATEAGAPAAVVPEEASPVVIAMPSRRITRDLSRRFQGLSQWRLPSTPGHLPRYLQTKFRIKTFGLMSLQLLLVFGIMVFIDVHQEVLFQWLDRGNKLHAQIVFYMFGLFTLASIMVLFCCKDRYPINYLLLAFTTLLSGAFWGLTRTVLTTTLHFQILGIAFCTMAIATPVSAVLSSLQRKIDAQVIVLASIASGWIVGVVVSSILTVTYTDTSQLVALGSVGFSFLLTGIFTLDGGRALIQCRPDDFMSVIVSMNSTLMVVVSIPFFVLSFCFLHTGEAVMEEVEAAPQNPVPNMFGQAAQANVHHSPQIVMG